MTARVAAGLLLLVVLLSGADTAWPDTPTLEQYFGAYVGRAVEQDGDGRVREERDIDIVISPYKRGGFQIAWVNVTLVDGRRDVPGVRRRPAESLFVPADNGSFYVAAPEFNPFRVREDVTALAGDAVRWAALDAGGLHVYAFVILEDGSYEMATYTRRLTATGLALEFERVLDGKVVRRMVGHAVRAE